MAVVHGAERRPASSSAPRTTTNSGRQLVPSGNDESTPVARSSAAVRGTAVADRLRAGAALGVGETRDGVVDGVARAFRRDTALGDAGETDAVVRKERDAVATLPDGRAHARDERRLLLVALGAGGARAERAGVVPRSSQEAADEARDALGGILAAAGRESAGRRGERLLAPERRRRLRAHTGLGLRMRAHDSERDRRRHDDRRAETARARDTAAQRR